MEQTRWKQKALERIRKTTKCTKDFCNLLGCPEFYKSVLKTMDQTSRKALCDVAVPDRRRRSGFCEPKWINRPDDNVYKLSNS